MSLCGTEGPLALELSCPICLQLFSEPVSLPCGHVYCRACLQKAMDTGVARHYCPECQAEYQGANVLVKNFKMCSIIASYKATAGKVRPETSWSDLQSHQGAEASNQSYDESSGCPLKGQREAQPRDKEVFQTGMVAAAVFPKSPNEESDDVKAEAEMAEHKSRLASQVKKLTLRLQTAEDVVKKEEEREAEVRAANAELRGRAVRLLEQMTELVLSYSAGVTELIEVELRPGEESLNGRVRQATELREKLREAQLQAKSLLAEKDGAVFSDELQTVQPRIVELMTRPMVDMGEDVESKMNPGRACSELVRKDSELRAGLGAAQRSLRNVLNPSEVTFDLETAHPNLVLSEDLKTVTFSATKQPYPALPQRFSSFLQVLSSQSFYGGEHCWEVEVEGSPWIIGVCYSGKLGRSGLPSALESSRSSWCLMWYDNLLRAFEQGHAVPLKKTSSHQRLEIRLSFKTYRLSFYSISPHTGKTHVYTFKANLTEPVSLAYRMMSGQPKARITVCS